MTLVCLIMNASGVWGNTEFHYQSVRGFVLPRLGQMIVDNCL